MKTEFSTFDIVKILEIPRERLKDWMNNGFVKPTTPAQGRGSRAVFMREDVYIIALFKNMISWGLKREVAARIIRDGDPTSDLGMRLVEIGDGAYYSADFQKVIDEVDKKIQEIYEVK